jgi:predicted permease
MRRLRSLFVRLLGALGLWATDSRVQEEIREHIELSTEDYVRAGMDRREARRQALLKFGSLDALTEACRDQRGLPTAETLVRDLQQACRALRREPGFTVSTVLMLGLGLGAATTMFSIVDGVLINPLRFRDPQRLVVVREVIPAFQHLYPTLPVNAYHFTEWQRDSTAFDGLALTYGGSSNLTGVGEPERVDAAWATTNLLRLLGVPLALGRDFHDDEGRIGGGTVALLGDGLWRRRFGANPRVVGTTVMLDGRSTTIVGVLPAHFRIPNRTNAGAGDPTYGEVGVLLPKIFSEADRTQLMGRHNYGVVARLKPGLTGPQAAGDLKRIQSRIDAQSGEHIGLGVEVTPLLDHVVGGARRGLTVLMAAIGIVVLIICVNLANLLLARGERRSHEYAARAALGASRARLAGHAFAEVFLLAAAGGAIATGLAALAVRLLRDVNLPQVPRLQDVALDWRIALFVVAAVGTTALVFGFLPAWRASRSDPQHALRPGGRGQADSRVGRRVRGLLVAGEVGLSVMLLCLAGLLTNSFVRVTMADKGFTAPTVLSLDLELAAAKYRDDANQEAFFRRVFASLAAEPSVTSAGISSALPLQGETWVDEAAPDASGRPGSSTPVNVRFVSADYFSTMGIPLVAGRPFAESDRGRSVTVISTRLAQFLWPGLDAIGRRFTRGNDQWFDVIGVVGDVRAVADQAPVVMMYRPYWEWATNHHVLVARAAGEASSVAGALRKAVRDADADLPIPEMRTMAAILDESLAVRRLLALVATGFAAMAVLVASLGIYAVVSYSVSRRTAEIGVRAALGANRVDLCRLVLAGSAGPVVFGLVAGLAAAAASGRLVDGLLYGIGGRDPGTLLAAATVLGLVALLACIVPAVRATRVDPVHALRYE